MLIGAVPDETWPASGLAQYVLGNGAPEHVAITAGDASESLTYRLLGQNSARCAAGLAALGIRRGDVVALHLPNTPVYAVAVLAVLRLGAVVAPCDARATCGELATIAGIIQPSLLITTPETKATAEDAAVAAGGVPVIEALPMRPDSSPIEVTIFPADPAVVAFTSGTSGTPKAAVLSHGGLIGSLRSAHTALPAAADDVFLALAPFAHVMGLWGHLLRGLAAGCTVVAMPRFQPSEFLAVLSTRRITQMIIPPPLVDLLAYSEEAAAHDLSALRVIYVGGSGAGAESERDCAARLGCVVAQGYGMTEAGPMIAVNPTDRDRVRHGSVGVALPCVELRVVDSGTYLPVPQGLVGEIWMRSPFMMSGYLGDSAATATSIDADGWLHTGDLGRLDSDGYLWLSGRIKDLIKCNGYQVWPAQLEEVLRRHRAVVDAVVVGRPDAGAGEVPVGFVIAGETVSVAELQAFVNERVSRPKWLREVHIVADFPRNSAGKVLRRKLDRTMDGESGDRG